MFIDEKPNPKQAYLSDEHAEIIKATLPPVGANIQTITKTFYNKMFTAHPSSSPTRSTAATRSRARSRRRWRRRWRRSPRSWWTLTHRTQ